MKKIKVHGTIVTNDNKWIYNLFDMDSTSPKDISDALAETTEDVTIEINSYGGYVDAGNQIYSDLKNYPGNVTVEVLMAGSAASVIAMAGDKVRMAPIGRIMIHNASVGAQGDYHAMDAASEALQMANSAIANAYVGKSGIAKEEALALMNKETWMDADKALEYGFVDEVIEYTESTPVFELVANGLTNGIIPQNVIDKVRNDKQLPMASVQVNTDEIVDKIYEKLKADFDVEIENNKKEEPKATTSFERFLF